MTKKEYIENLELLIVNYLYEKYNNKLSLEEIKENFKDILIYDIQNKEGVVKGISSIIEDEKFNLEKEQDIKKHKKNKELIDDLKLNKEEKKTIQTNFNINNENVEELIKLLKLNIKTSVIPSLFQFGKSVKFNDTLIEKIEEQLEETETIIFSAKIIDPSSKNVFRFEPTEENYEEYNLVGIKNTINNNISSKLVPDKFIPDEFIPDKYVGGSKDIPYFKLSRMLIKLKKEKKNLLNLDIVKIFKDDDFYFIKNVSKKLEEKLEEKLDEKKTSEKEKYELNSNIIQITIPINEDLTGNNEDFITITPLHSLQQKGVIGEKIEEINIDKNNEYRINAERVNKSINNILNISPFMGKYIKISSFLSIPPNFDLDYQIKNIKWNFNKHGDLDDDSVNQIKYYILNEIYNSGLNAKKMKNLYRFFEQEKENRRKKNYIYNFFMYSSLRILNNIKKEKYEKYFKDKKEFSKKFYNIYEDVLVIYFRKVLSLIHANNTDGYKKFEDKLFVLYKAINESFEKSNFREKEIELKTLKMIEELEAKKEKEDMEND